MRDNPTQIPNFEEVNSLLSIEAQRDIPKEKEATRYVDFQPLVNLLEAFGLRTPFLVKNEDLATLDKPTLFDNTRQILNDLMVAILSSPEKENVQEYLDELYDYLSQEDPPEKADLLFVFGSKMTLRTEKAIRLYKEGLAPKIMISGRCPFYERKKCPQPEAEVLGEFAQTHGVPESDLILEKESMSIPGNIKGSLNLLETLEIPHKRIILVNSPFSQRRGWAHFSKMSNVGTTLIRANTDTVSEQFSRAGWYKNETGTKVVIKEWFSMWASTLINTS